MYARNNSGTNVDAIHFDHGVIRKQADGYMVNYFLNDHLGSTRVVVDGNGAVLEKNDYYPFGARHKRNDYQVSDNRYKYNGKEEQVIGGVGFLDYGARFYDPEIGRWNVIDPLAEKGRRWSPYATLLMIPSDTLILTENGRGPINPQMFFENKESWGLVGIMICRFIRGKMQLI